MISCYDPIEDAEKEEEAWVPNHDMLEVIGDLNARVGNGNTDRESNMDTHGC